MLMQYDLIIEDLIAIIAERLEVAQIPLFPSHANNFLRNSNKLINQIHKSKPF